MYYMRNYSDITAISTLSLLCCTPEACGCISWLRLCTLCVCRAATAVGCAAPCTTARHKCIDMSSIPVRAVATAVTPLFEAALLPPDHKRQHERPKIKEDLRQAEDESDIP